MRLLIWIISVSMLAPSVFANVNSKPSEIKIRMQKWKSEKDKAEKQFVSLVQTKQEKDIIKAIRSDKDYFLVNTKIKDQPLLIYCIKNKMWKTTEQIISNGANLNIEDSDGKVALMYAAEARNKYIVKLLIASKADDSIKDKKGITASEYLQTNGML